MARILPELMRCRLLEQLGLLLAFSYFIQLPTLYDNVLVLYGDAQNSEQLSNISSGGLWFVRSRLKAQKPLILGAYNSFRHRAQARG